MNSGGASGKIGRPAREVWMVRRRRARASAALAPAGISWFVVRISGAEEFRAQRMLSRLGVWVFLPTETKWRRLNRYARDKQRRDYPLLARYLIVGLTEGGPGWLALFNTGLIRGIVCENGRPYRLYQEEVEALNEALDAGAYVAPASQRFMRTGGEFAAGDDVFIVEGPYEGRRVTVADIVGSAAKVPLAILGEKRLVDVPLDALVRAA